MLRMAYVLSGVLFIVIISTPNSMAEGCRTITPSIIRPVAPIVNAPVIVNQDQVLLQTNPTAAVTINVQTVVPAFSLQFVPTAPVQQAPTTPTTATEHSVGKAKPDSAKIDKQDIPIAIYDESDDTVPIKPASSFNNGKLANVVGILNNRCSECHSGRGKGGVSIFAADGRFAPNISSSDIAKVILSNKMPLGADKDPAKRLDDLEKQLIQEWVLAK